MNSDDDTADLAIHRLSQSSDVPPALPAPPPRRPRDARGRFSATHTRNPSPDRPPPRPRMSDPVDPPHSELADALAQALGPLLLALNKTAGGAKKNHAATPPKF